MAEHYNYNASSSSHSPNNSSSFASASLHTQSLDLFEQTRFRVEGGEAAWEARKIRSSSDLLSRLRLNWMESPKEGGEEKKAMVPGPRLGLSQRAS
ncbi:hypothetical protein NL676_014224 [Syzygium grande]|nr:hypothetical protein NL676_014224 [Syzygium grande]